MLIRHRGSQPQIDPSTWVASTAVLSGDVTVGPGVRILHGAVVSAEDGAIAIGADTVVMEHALIRGRAQHPVEIGAAVMVGPSVHVNGAVVGDGAFLATGAAIFPGARIGAAAEVRIHAVVHVNTVLEPGAVVPIGWVAVGDPASILSPEKHDEIWAIQKTLDVPGTVYGAVRDTPMTELMRGQSSWFGAHRWDETV